MRYIPVISAALFGIATQAIAQPSPSEQIPQQSWRVTSSTKRNEALGKVDQARRLFADSVPEDRTNIETLLNDAIRLDPYSEESFAELGRYLTWQVAIGLRTQSDLYMALELGDHVRDLAPNRPLGEFLRCETLGAMGRAEEAQKVCNLAEEKYANHPDTNVFKARYYAESNPKVALESAQKALAQGVNPDAISLHIATAITHSIDPKDQGRMLANFARIYPDRWLWHKAAVAYAADHKAIEAKEAFQVAIGLGNEIESRLQLALLEATQLKEHSQAIAEYESVLSNLRTRNNKNKSLVAGIRARMSIVYLDSGSITEAILNASRAIVEDPTETALIQAVFETFSAKKLGEKLIPALSIATRENPFFSYAHLTLGDLASQRKEFENAIKHYTKVAALLPDEDFPYAKRAHAYYALKNFSAALNDFNSAIEAKPDDASHHYNRSCMLALLGKNTEAMASLRTAISLEPKLVALAATDSDLTGLRTSQEFKPQMAALGLQQNPEKPRTAAAEVPAQP